jgi:hypothetical protein
VPIRKKKYPYQGRPEPKRDKNGLTRCRVCGCTYIEPCNPPCSWVDNDLCSTCHATVDMMVGWLDAAHRPSMVALKREVKLARLERAHP